MQIGTLAPASTRGVWSEDKQLVDVETGEAVSLADIDEITLAVRDPDSQALKLSGTLTGGEIELLDDLTFRWTFPAERMRSLSAKSYGVGVTFEIDGETVQVLIGSLPVLDGIVS
jgi:hypothetical protein